MLERGCSTLSIHTPQRCVQEACIQDYKYDDKPNRTHWVAHRHKSVVHWEMRREGGYSTEL